MASILFERGKSTSTQKAVKDGKITYKTDTSELYFDVGNKRQEINANDAKTVGGASLNTITTGYQNYINEEISPLAAKLDYTNIAYGACATAADVATKEITLNSNVNHWKQEIGSMIAIKFDISNSASNVKIKVGNNDAYPIWYNNAEYTSTSTSYTGYANRLIVYMFNGTHWVWITSSYDSNTTYTNEKLGNGYGTCSTAESTTAKKATFSSYTLVKHGMVSIKFTYNVPANSTLNINSKGAKNIYYRGAKIIANIIKAGDIATFVYDGTQYQLIAIDRWQNDIDTLTTDLSQLSNVVDTKAPKDSPTLTGTPTAPTAAAGTNTTQIATTAFVKTALDSKITGPSTSVDTHVAVFDGTNTKKIKDSGFTIASNVPANAKFTDTTYELVTDTAAGLMSSDQKNKLDYIEAEANKYILPNAGTELGGVKTGGDVTISNGVITVNDDSHNHIIGNIDGLQDKFKAIDNAFDATVDGPSSSTTNNIAVFADGTGKTIKDSGFTINKNVPADAKFTDTVYSLPVANTNALGGVKAGGDVNIDATGIITVKDDSHNHTIANIDELQNKLNEKAPLDSPTFTGTPKAPDTTNTATSSQIVTVNDLTKKINNLALGDASKRGVDTTPTSNSKKLIESGGVYTSITTLNNQIDTKANKNAGIFYIEGAGTTDTTNKVAAWTGTHDDIENYYEGLMIAYKIGTAGSTTTTLNINNLGATTVVKNNTTAISTNFPVNAVIFLVYTLDGTTAYWKAHDYDANTRNSVGDYRKNSTKLYFVGTTSSDSSTSSSYATSYTNSYCYVGTDNCLYAYHSGNKQSEKVAFAVDLVPLQNQIDTKAPLNSPAFTGNPTAPTPSATDNDTSIATTAFVQTAINQVLSASSAMTFKGKINQYEPDDDIDGIYYFTLPSRGDVGDTYIISNNGRIGSHICEIGDLAICIKSYSVLPPVTESDNIDDIWTVVQTNINGAVTGPTSSINKNVAIFDGTTGTLIKDSNLNIDTITSAINEIPALKEHVNTYGRNDYVYTAANQALTNKTYNGYTLKDAAGRGVDSAPAINSKNLVESGGLYTKFTEINNRFNALNANDIGAVPTSNNFTLSLITEDNTSHNYTIYGVKNQ